jgi:hypothetical protein
MTAGAFAQSIDRHKAEATAPAQEVLEHVYEDILAMPEFTLKDGTKAHPDALSPPELNAEGELACGFDVMLDNGAHLEFYLKNTGWGKSFAAAHAPGTPTQGRGR